MNLQVTKKILDLGKNLNYIAGLLDPFFYKYNLSDKFKIKIAEPAVKNVDITKSKREFIAPISLSIILNEDKNFKKVFSSGFPKN